MRKMTWTNCLRKIADQAELNNNTIALSQRFATGNKTVEQLDAPLFLHLIFFTSDFAGRFVEVLLVTPSCQVCLRVVKEWPELTEAN